MKDPARSMDVLKKLLQKGEAALEQAPAAEVLVENFFRPTEKALSKKAARPGRPSKEDHLKARNFTLCLDPKYLSFLDHMKVKDPKIAGRGRKIRFIIDQFVELHRRQKHQLQTLAEALSEVETVLKSFSAQVIKGKKLDLSSREKITISQAVKQVSILLKILGYTPKELQRLLPRNQWSVLSFCLDWMRKSETK